MKKPMSRRAKQTVWWLGLIISGGLLIAGCATHGGGDKFSDLPPDLNTAGADGGTNGNRGGLEAVVQYGDRFVLGDQVTVKLTGTIEQIPPHEERIKDDGTITLPLIGAVKAEGKTSGELQKEILGRYVPDYYRRLVVIVTGEQRVYSVGGQVKLPGRQVYMSATTVTKAIQSAGDFTDFAAKRRVELTRPNGKRFTVDCVKAGQNPALDLPVYPGDKINVPQRGVFDFN